MNYKGGLLIILAVVGLVASSNNREKRCKSFLMLLCELISIRSSVYGVGTILLLLQGR